MIQIPSELRRYMNKFIEQLVDKQGRLDKRKKRAILTHVVDNLKLDRTDLIRILKKMSGDNIYET